MSSTAPNPLAILEAAITAPAEGNFYFDATDPAAVYGGAASFSCGQLAEKTVQTARGLFNPPLARWLGNLGYYALLVEPLPTDPAERPDPSLVPLRNELAVQYARFALRQTVQRYAHSPKATGVEPGWTLQRVYEKLGERPAGNPWQANQRLSLAAMLSEPVLNALVIADTYEERLDEEHCVDGDPTTLSLGKFITFLNRSTAIDSRSIFGAIYTETYAKRKREFIEALLAWVDSGQSKYFELSFDDAYDRYPLPASGQATAQP
jgi:hypothetical protein